MHCDDTHDTNTVRNDDQPQTEPGHRVTGHRVTGSPGHRVTGSRATGSFGVSSGRVGSLVTVLDPVFDPVLSFNMRVDRGVVSKHHRGKLIST